MEDDLKDLELKIYNLRNLIDIAHSYVEQIQDDDINFCVFSSISEIIKNDISGICADYAKMRDKYTAVYTLPARTVTRD